VLNTRAALRKRNAGMASIPQSPSSIEPLTMNFLVTSSNVPVNPISVAGPENPSVAKPQPVSAVRVDVAVY
jgi:hypothetical protein